jgi:aspartate carbamoyltransferase regulatory subunit
METKNILRCANPNCKTPNKEVKWGTPLSKDDFEKIKKVCLCDECQVTFSNEEFNDHIEFGK